MPAAFPVHPTWGTTAICRPDEMGRADVSIHAPLAGRDRMRKDLCKSGFHFNPRAPCGARRDRHLAITICATFQSTRPLRGATVKVMVGQYDTMAFQPTRPLRGATGGGGGLYPGLRHFNPRAPCGARLAPLLSRYYICTHFNPRAPCGARPWSYPYSIQYRLISTHAPLAGRDG